MSILTKTGVSMYLNSLQWLGWLVGCLVRLVSPKGWYCCFKAKLVVNLTRMVKFFDFKDCLCILLKDTVREMVSCRPKTFHESDVSSVSGWQHNKVFGSLGFVHWQIRTKRVIFCIERNHWNLDLIDFSFDFCMSVVIAVSKSLF